MPVLLQYLIRLEPGALALRFTAGQIAQHRPGGFREIERHNMKTETNTAPIKQIVNRAKELAGSMSHGEACFAACREMGVEESQVAAVASIVSSEITNGELAAMRACAPSPEQHAAALGQEDEIQKLSMRLDLGAQSRQGVRRRLRSQGLTSDYAKALYARAAALEEGATQ